MSLPRKTELPATTHIPKMHGNHILSLPTAKTQMSSLVIVLAVHMKESLDIYLSHDMIFLTMCFLSSADSDEPVQPPFKFRNSMMFGQ